MTLDCVTDWDPDINVYWARRKNESDESEYLTKSRLSFPNGEMNEELRDDPRISVFVNVSSNNMSMNIAFHISNITEQDSAEYGCFSDMHEYLYFYDISVVTCNCSIDTNVTCNIIGFNTPKWLPMTIIFNGKTVITLLNGNRLEFEHEHVNEMAIEHSIHVSSDDGPISNITCILPVQSKPSSTQRTTTTVLLSQPRQSSAQGTTWIIDRTSEPSSSHEFLSTLVTSLQYTKSTTMSPQSRSQWSLRSSSSPPFLQPSIFSSSEMVPLETSSSLIPSPPRTTESIEIQATSLTKRQEQTDSSRIKTISSAKPKSPLAVNESKTTMSASSSSPSQPVSTVRTSISSKEAQPRPTPSQQTAPPSTLTYTAPLPQFSLPQTEKTSMSSLATLSTTLPTNQKTIKNIIIALCVSISAGVIFMAVIIVMKFRRRYYKSSNLETIEDCSDSTDPVGSLS